MGRGNAVVAHHSGRSVANVMRIRIQLQLEILRLNRINRKGKYENS
jgi:hypothetical protein